MTTSFILVVCVLWHNCVCQHHTQREAKTQICSCVPLILRMCDRTCLHCCKLSTCLGVIISFGIAFLLDSSAPPVFSASAGCRVSVMLLGRSQFVSCQRTTITFRLFKKKKSHCDLCVTITMCFSCVTLTIVYSSNHNLSLTITKPA